VGYPARTVYIYSEGGMKVGEIYVDRASDAVKGYTEHWVVFDTYRYPDRLVPAPQDRQYKSLDDFFARAPFKAGYEYIKVDAVHASTLPRR
jgi:hypothetical protein